MATWSPAARSRSSARPARPLPALQPQKLRVHPGRKNSLKARRIELWGLFLPWTAPCPQKAPCGRLEPATRPRAIQRVPPHDGSAGKPGGLLQQRHWPALLLLGKGRHGRLFHFFKFSLRGFLVGFGRGFFIIPTTGQHEGTKHNYQHYQSFHRPAPIILSVCGSGIAPGAFPASFPWSGLRSVAYSALLHGRALWLNRDCPCDIPQ